MKADLDRRELVAGLIGLALGGSSLACGPPAGEILRGAAGRFSEAARRDALELGRRYLEAHPDDRDPKKLARALAEGRHLVGELDLQKRMREELARGETVSVDGWWLSVTGARLLAAAALLGS